MLHLVGMNQAPVPMCKAFVRGVIVLFLCIKCMDPLSFDSSVETDIVRRFATFAKVFVSSSAGTRTRDLSHGTMEGTDNV